jgi:hypothetical protein
MINCIQCIVPIRAPFRLGVLLLGIAVAPARADQAATAPVVTREGPIAKVVRELYMPYPRAGQSYVIGNQYVGHEGLERFQVRTLQVHDDVYQDAAIRHSQDNGRTWSDFRRDPERDIVVKGGYAQEPYIFSGCYDPASRRMVRTILMRTHQGDPRVAGYKTMWDHTLWQTSADDGHTWDTPRLLKYEAGAEFSPLEFGNREYLDHNRSYSGYNVIALKDGRIATACCVTTQITNEAREKESVCGVILFTAKWDGGRQTYEWSHSNPVAVSRRISDRGLMEPWVAQLQSGDLFIDMRGNATTANPGRNFYAVSKDGGATLSEARDLRFDDRTQFYAPSSLSMMWRHSQNRRLYWFGNISAKPTSGNSPRYPLCIAEVDEIQPALKRSSLTTIDDYDPKTQTAAVQFSNFSLIEDRRTHAFEIYMTVWGEYPNVYQANVYRYIIALK